MAVYLVNKAHDFVYLVNEAHDLCFNRYPHVDKDHLVKLLKQLILHAATPSGDASGGGSSSAASVPTLLGTGSFSLLGCMC